jgi:type II secretory pathway component PulJ
LRTFLRGPRVFSFTLIELMAASAVLSVVLLMMLGMQDQMSRAWNNANRRMEATREARTAIRLMASDLAALRYRNTNFRHIDASPSAVSGKPVPWVFFSGSGTPLLTIPGASSNSAYIFGIAPRSLTTNNEDLQLVGYYVALSTNTNLSGFRTISYNLHRYYRNAAQTADQLEIWFQNSNVPQLFAGIHPTNDEVVAQNVGKLFIQCYAANINSNGANYSFDEWYAPNYNGSKMHVSMTLYPEDAAQVIPIADWGKSNHLAKSGRSYEFRVDWLRAQYSP